MRKIALIGGGPAALFMYKRIIEAGDTEIEVHIFEQHEQLGAGMPYSKHGATKEHITNVSDNEIPDIKTPIKDWIEKAPQDILQEYDINPQNFNEYKVLPRLMFGQYLTQQFDTLLSQGRAAITKTIVHYNTKIIDIIDLPEKKQTRVASDEKQWLFDNVIICTGHSWPKALEEKFTNYFESPYPPHKISLRVNYPVAVRGASLTAVDAIRSLSHANGHFTKLEDDTYKYHLNKDSMGFKIVLHSIGALLPAMRFHLEDTHLTANHLLTYQEILEIKEKNDGFVP
ncbi:MAG: FAD/NAD(P)-binding protein, partial [Chitinophagaceae bacterium]